MKKILFFIFITLFLFSCSNNIQEKKPLIYQDIKNNIQWSYLWSNYKWNYVWWWSMNLAWNELNENILREKLQLDTNDKIALEI